jgi:hypothetical protein
MSGELVITGAIVIIVPLVATLALGSISLGDSSGLGREQLYYE